MSQAAPTDFALGKHYQTFQQIHITQNSKLWEELLCLMVHFSCTAGEIAKHTKYILQSDKNFLCMSNSDKHVNFYCWFGFYIFVLTCVITPKAFLHSCKVTEFHETPSICISPLMSNKHKNADNKVLFPEPVLPKRPT